MATDNTTEGAYWVLEARQGDSLLLPITYTDSDGVPVNVTGYHFEFMVNVVTQTTYTTSPEIVVVNAALGKLELALSAAQTTLLTKNRGKYYFRATDASGVVLTLLYGDISVQLTG